MSKYTDLLRDDSILIVNRKLAVAVGLDASITLRQVVHWMDYNRNKDKDRNFRDGHWWTYNTYDKWQEENFPFWSISAIRRNFATLENLGLVLATSSYNTIAIDKTKWYTVDFQAYERFMELWENMGTPVCSNGGKTSIAYKKFLDAWKQARTTVHCEQTTVLDEHMDCSQSTDHESTENKAIPEINTEISTENKEKESSSSDELLSEQPITEILESGETTEVPEVSVVEEPSVKLQDDASKQETPTPKPDIVDIAEAHLEKIAAKPKSSKTTKADLPMLRPGDTYSVKDWQLVLSKSMKFSLTKSGCQRMAPYIRFFNGTCDYKPKKGESEYNLYQCNGDIGGDDLENVTPLSLVQVVALTLYYRAWREPNNKEKQATIYLPPKAQTLQEKCRNFLADADYDKWIAAAESKLGALLNNTETLETKASNGARFDNFSAPKPEDYKRPEWDYIDA